MGAQTTYPDYTTYPWFQNQSAFSYHRTLKRKTKPPLKNNKNLIPISRNISFQNLTSIQKYLKLQSRFSTFNQYNNIAQPPSPAQWCAREHWTLPNVPFTRQWDIEAAWHVQATPKASATQPPASVPHLMLLAFPQKTLIFSFCSNTYQRENTHKTFTCAKPPFAIFSDYLTVLWDTWVVTEINCEHFLFSKW